MPATSRTAPRPGPVDARHRIALLDGLRGFALAGIFLVNARYFSGVFLLPPADAAALPLARFDAATAWVVGVLVEGKFVALFSLLFGAGFALQERRSPEGAAFDARFRRRLWGLLAIGALHALLLWAGDILAIYALLGFTLPWLRRRSDGFVLRLAAALWLLPVALYAVLWAAGMPGLFELAATLEPAPTGPPLPERMQAAFAQGTYGAVLWANALTLAARLFELLLEGFFAKVLALFLAGYVAGRRRLFRDAALHRRALRRVVAVGAPLGLAACTAWTVLEARDVFLPASGLGLVQAAAYAVGVPALAAAYAAGLARWFGRPSGGAVLRALAPTGRTALTGYLLQSVAGVGLFYGLGLGLYQRVGLTGTVLLALAVVALQLALSAAWLRAFRYGPAEWLWRCWTYGRWV